jgi:hypothetical protein
MMPLKNIKEKRLKSLSLQIVMEEQMTTRRVAACIDNVEIVDLLVDGDNDMVQSIDTVLAQIANEDGSYIIAEIPTRVEVPNLIDLKNVLSQERKTAAGTIAIDPVLF